MNKALVQAHYACAALARARVEVHPACDLMMTTTLGVLALVLPEDLGRRPDAPILLRRLTAIADDFEHRAGAPGTTP